MNKRRGTDQRIFVGVPTFNRPAGLHRAVMNLLEQSHDNIAVLISDNASSDPEVEHVGRTLASSDKRVRYVRHASNLGSASNFRFVLEQADAPYFMWSADDDYRSADCLARYLDGIGDSGAFFGTYATFDTRTNEVIEQMEVPLLTGHAGDQSDIATILRHPSPSMVYGLLRTDVAKTCWPRDVFDWSDCYFILRVLKQSGFRTESSIPTYFAGIPGEYVPKPFNGSRLRPWGYVSRAFPIALSSGIRPTLAHLRTSAALLRRFA